MEILIIITLLFIGLLLVIIELFFLPGVTIAGISALLFFGGAVYYAFGISGAAGILTTIISVVVCIGGVLLFMRSRVMKKISLDTTINSVVPTSIPHNVKVGDEGITLSRLNPMGKVLINGHEMEGRARESFLDENTKIEVERIESTVVIVKKSSKKTDNNHKNNQR